MQKQSKGGAYIKAEFVEVYTTKNLLIRMLAHNWLRQIEGILKSIDASALNGLDVGCAEGYMLNYLYQQGAVSGLTAVDIEEDKLAYAKEHYPFFDYVKGDVHQLDFQDGTFDYVIATEILEHLPDPGLALKELNRVSRENAYVIISVPNEPFFHWGNLLRGKYWARGGRTPSHLHFWNRSEFETFIRDYILIEQAFHFKTFPWMLYLGKMRADAGYS